MGLGAWRPLDPSLGEIVHSRDFWNQVQILGSPFMSCGTVGKLHNFSQCQSPRL